MRFNWNDTMNPDPYDPIALAARMCFPTRLSWAPVERGIDPGDIAGGWCRRPTANHHRLAADDRIFQSGSQGSAQSPHENYRFADRIGRLRTVYLIDFDD